MNLSKQLKSIVEELGDIGELEKDSFGEPIVLEDETEDEIVTDDITDLSGDEEEEEDELEDDEEDEMTEEEADVEIEKEEKELTEEEVDAENDYEKGEEAPMGEAKSDYPKAKQIKSLKALVTKLRAKGKTIKSMSISASNDWSKAKSNKDRKGMLAATKEKKKYNDLNSKNSAVIARANTQLQKLEDERKAHNKKKASDKKAAAKK